ncbi:MAG: Lrp/AsnC family transcriptional regulator [Acidobacteria bacterium]|nr:Lrp/AsnC family transcriptional regulator [Acidobacteriota bacterium]
MDDLDRKLAARLANDARATWADLGAELGLSPPAVADRAKRLCERGVIRGYHAVLDPVALGYGLTAFVAVTLTHPRDRAKFLAVVAKREEIKEAHHMAGDDDFLLKVHCRDTQHLEHFLTSILKSIPGVQRTRTSIALGTAKDLATLQPPRAVS